MTLRLYRAKRNFTQTKEPVGNMYKARGAKKSLRFVIQKHDATRLHYDFRLEMESVLKSWAIPKGVPMKKGERHLAVQVEDHPIEYGNFEGTIPAGNYGAGTVMLWDNGTYEVSGEDPLNALKVGKLHLTLHGKKLKGEWTLVRMRGSEEKPQWLILKSKDDMELPEKQYDRSVKSGRSMDEIASDKKRKIWMSTRPEEKSQAQSFRSRIRAAALQASLPRAKSLKVTTENTISFVEPMNAKLVDQLPAGDHWIYEIKFDGIRCLSILQNGRAQLFSRNEKENTSRFSEIAEALPLLPCENAILDGEIVALDEKGRSSFQLLQSSLLPGAKPYPIVYYLFDILHLDGKDLRSKPLVERKKILKELMKNAKDPLRYSANIEATPKKLLEEVKQLGLEGLVAKQTSSKYEVGRRSGAWSKIKCTNQQEFVIGGYTEPKATRKYFGSVLVGYFEKGKLIFSSKVGTGFDTPLLKNLYHQFQSLKSETCPFTNLPSPRSVVSGISASEMKRCTWIEPKLVCEIRFTEWTRDGSLRHPVFLGLREDKNPNEVVREESR
jgi:bifunctional non-homologous end joining protein LigD